MMDRLREFSIVTLSLPDSARVSEFKAYVVGVHRTVATLQPVERVELSGHHRERPDDVRPRQPDGRAEG